MKIRKSRGSRIQIIGINLTYSHCNTQNRVQICRTLLTSFYIRDYMPGRMVNSGECHNFLKYPVIFIISIQVYIISNSEICSANGRYFAHNLWICDLAVLIFNWNNMRNFRGNYPFHRNANFLVDLYMILTSWTEYLWKSIDNWLDTEWQIC